MARVHCYLLGSPVSQEPVYTVCAPLEAVLLLRIFVCGSFDIYTNAGLTAAQFAAENPGLDCSLIQPGQKVCVSSGSLPSNAPSASPNGTCFEYHVIPNDSCSGIALKFDMTVAEIEQWNAQTYKWTGCPALQIGFTMCVSSGTPPLFRAYLAVMSPNPCISNCFTPTIPSCGTGSVKRNLAYYAGWADRRPCGISVPGDTDWSGYTHAHFAFAVISQSSEIQLVTADVPLLQALVAEKAANPGLKVLIAVGGWDFSEADPTRDLFSVTIGSAQTRSAFIASVKTFLAPYQLDGINIDFGTWRYAESEDDVKFAFFRISRGHRAGRACDGYAEPDHILPRAALSARLVRAHIMWYHPSLSSPYNFPESRRTSATPAGHWFLKGFEIDKIAAQVDYINMMSYDYHGQWDTNVTDQAPVTNPHTSIEDMTTSVLLYTRAGIDMSKVNVGLAWYGRTYHVSDASCKGYNCTMVGGGAAGTCSGASGYLTQFEITDILAGGITPTLDRASETYWFDNAVRPPCSERYDMLIPGRLGRLGHLRSSGYMGFRDDFGKKQAFAASTCFGGTFVWSVDEVLANGGSGSGGGGGGGFDSFSLFPWNPNPHPSAGAQSETFVVAESSVVIPTPTLTTFISVGGGIITLNPGGTPVNALLPSTVSEVNAVTSTWTFNIVPPTSVPSITSTTSILGVETFSTVIPSPSSGVVTMTGPAGGVWTLTAGPSGASILGTLPTSIGISGGMTPTATPPVGWLGPWTDPVPPHSVTTMQPVQSNTDFTWNPDPFPPPGVTSETFICSGTTTSIPIPTATTTISAGGATIVLNSGGTPVNEPLASQCIEVAGILPTWSQDIFLPPGASIITFTGPLTSAPTWVTTVPVPPKSDSSEATVVGPPGDKNRCNDLNLWSLLFGGIIHPCLPLDVGIIGGITPVPVPPPGWTGPWTDPIPRPTLPPGGPGNSETETSTSTSSSSSSDAACPTKPASLDLPDDADNSDCDGDGTDPDQRRRRSQVQVILRGKSLTFVRPSCPCPAQMMLGYISQFVGAAPMTNGDCTWYFGLQKHGSASNRVPGFKTIFSTTFVLTAPPWVWHPLNQAKSNVVNQNSDTAANPPQLATMSFLKDAGEFDSDAPQIYATEDFLRHLAALGQSISLRDARPVPACFELYAHNQYTPSTFAPQNLMPPAPQSPQCNVPGVVGTLVYVQTVPSGALAPVGVFPYGGTSGPSGSWDPEIPPLSQLTQNFYAVGSGPSISGRHVQGRPLDGSQYQGCGGSYLFDDVPPGTAGYSTANIAFSCNGFSQQQDVTINYVMNGQPIPSCILVRKDGQSPWLPLCSPTSTTRDACSESFILLGGLGRRVTLDPLTLSLSISRLGFAGPGGL
ncbi:hypothetical protein DFH09DRAFT_1433054 [Mycena vulgaris]|nr:hypothetical protein DFH09DRAFT_1433054 [Mycena vulgaris]